MNRTKLTLSLLGTGVLGAVTVATGVACAFPGTTPPAPTRNVLNLNPCAAILNMLGDQLG